MTGDGMDDVLHNVQMSLPDWARADAEALLATIKPVAIPAWSDKQEFVFLRALCDVVDSLGTYAQDDFRHVIEAIQSAPLFPADLRFTIALQAPSIVARRGVRGIREYLAYIEPITERSVFAAVGFASLTKEELAASPISLDALCYATARTARYYAGPVLMHQNPGGDVTFTNGERVSAVSRTILQTLQGYPESLRAESAEAALPFYNKIAPITPTAMQFLERFGEVYTASSSLGRPFGVACARARYRSDTLHQALEVATHTHEHIEASGLQHTIEFWEHVANIRRPCWEAAKLCAQHGDEALLHGDWLRVKPLMTEVAKYRSSEEALAFVTGHAAIAEAVAHN